MGELPVFTCRGNVFTIDPSTRKTWIPACRKAIDVNFFYDSNKQCYRIISVQDCPYGKKVVINCAITEKMTFKQTSQKFGQWVDTKSSEVYGLGFASAEDLSKFVNQFRQCVEAAKHASIGPSKANSRGTLSEDKDLEPPIPGNPGMCNSNQGSLVQAIVSTVPALLHKSSSLAQNTLAPSTGAQLQAQLNMAHNKIRRLESELTVAKLEASLNPGFESPRLPRNDLPAPCLLDNHMDRRGDSELRDLLNRLRVEARPSPLEETRRSAQGGADDEETPRGPNEGPPEEAFVGEQARLEAALQMHARLGRILLEALELHSQLEPILREVATPGRYHL